MKKGSVYQAQVREVRFPNKGVVVSEDTEVIVKDVLEGEVISFQFQKHRKGKGVGRLVEVISRAAEETEEPVCSHFSLCGGCTYQTISHTSECRMKEKQLRSLLKEYVTDEAWEGVYESPQPLAYRNKMEFTFGDEYKGGPLALGMHKKQSMFDIVSLRDCALIPADMQCIVSLTRQFFSELGLPYLHRFSHEGYLRHLLLRRAQKTGQILIDLVTTSQIDIAVEEEILAAYTAQLLGLERDSRLHGTIAGILHTVNDSLADVIQNDRTDILYGQDHFDEELLGLRFRITPFSFFQTNSLGAEVLYSIVRDYVGTARQSVIYDLYSGTGTIAQVVAPVADKVVGVEIVEEAVVAARENAERNQLPNCFFHAGDVLRVIDELQEKPDLIILDPPRDGIHPKAIGKIIDFGVDQIVYVSCKPTSLVRDLAIFAEAGYRVTRACAVNMYNRTVHVESVVLMSRAER